MRFRIAFHASHKAQGKPELGAEGTQVSELRKRAGNSNVKFSSLTFGVEGALIALAEPTE